MKLKNLLGWSSALCLGASALQAQETNEAEAIRKQLKEANEALQKAMESYRSVTDSLNKRLEAIEKKQGVAGAAPPTAPVKNAESLSATTKTNVASATSVSAEQTLPRWSPAQPLTIARAGSAYMNISFDALIDAGWSTDPDVSQALNLGDHDPSQRGFSLRNAELALDGAVDPYFKGFGNIVLKLDNDGETDIELEEVYAQSSSLPANLQLKAGQFFAAAGRQNPQHPHQWAFVDSPLILTRTFGPDGLRNLGAQMSWLVPTPFYLEAFLGVFNGAGETAFSFRNPGENDGSGTDRVHGRATIERGLDSPGDLLYTPRLAASFELTDQQTLVVGTSAAFGPNDTGSDRRTQIYGVDVYWKWKPANARESYPFLAWQTEGLYQHFQAGADASAGLPAESLDDYGFYSQILWGFRQRWVAGLRGEYVTGNQGAFDAQDVFRGKRTRVSPNLTWYLSEFSKLRLQYDYDHGQHFGDEHSVWLQFEFLLGAHGAHKF